MNDCGEKPVCNVTLFCENVVHCPVISFPAKSTVSTVIIEVSVGGGGGGGLVPVLGVTCAELS